MPALQWQAAISSHRSVSKQAQVALQGLLRQLSDHFGDNHAMTVNKERLRDATDAVVDSSGAGIVYDVRIGNPIGLQEGQSSTPRILKIDAEENNPLAVYTPPRCLQESRLDFTEIAPGCPQDEHDRLPCQTGQIHF